MDGQDGLDSKVRVFSYPPKSTNLITLGISLYDFQAIICLEEQEGRISQ